MITINKAVEHFVFKLKNVWKPTSKDGEAINEIINFVNDKHKKQFSDNQLFAKLYIHYLGKLLRFHQCSVFDGTPEKELNRIFNTPIESLINEFTAIANDQETFIKMKSVGISEKHPLLKSESEKYKEKGKFELEMLEPVMTYEEAE